MDSLTEKLLHSDEPCVRYKTWVYALGNDPAGPEAARLREEVRASPRVQTLLAEAGLIGDPRCADALDLLESKRLPDGGFPAEAKYYGLGRSRKSGRDLVDWGGVSRRKSNPFVTVDALHVLRAAGRCS